ncbi:hypothetical protein MHW47_32750, partial [Streptomyces sp. OfavH-34-F]|nr:hypothetical protein [Streptomyces sp. OfavH-34-F]
MEHPNLVDTLDGLLRPRGASGRVLVTGWFSFPDGEVTAGDFLAERAVSQALDQVGVPHESAWSPHFAPGARTLEAAPPERYEHLLFVCGPVHGPQLTRLHERYARCRRTAVGVSVVDGDDPAARCWATTTTTTTRPPTGTPTSASRCSARSWPSSPGSSAGRPT